MFSTKEIEIKVYLEQLVGQYFEYVKVDDKPEKGERKLADDQALLVADVIDGYLSHTPNKSLELFKICFLE